MISGNLDAASGSLRAGDFAIVPAILPGEARHSWADKNSRWLEIRIPGAL